MQMQINAVAFDQLYTSNVYVEETTAPITTRWLKISKFVTAIRGAKPSRS